MIFLVAVLIGLLVGFAVRGRLAGLTNMALRATWLLLPFLFIDVFMNSRYSVHMAADSQRWLVLMLLSVQYIALFILVVLNARRWPLVLIGIGELLNYLVIMANGGRMPVDTSSLSVSPRLQALLSGLVPHYGALTAQTRLPFLGDIIPLQMFSPSLLSVGDFVIVAGLFLLIVHAMKSPVPKPS